jgi:hypothetical protein
MATRVNKMLSLEQVKKADSYNKGRSVAHYLGSGDPQAVAAKQKELSLVADGMFGPSTRAAVRLDGMLSSSVAPPDFSKVAQFVSKFEGKYWSMNRDGEFRGLFDRNEKKHWASGKYHIGLSFGYIQFTQDGGALGVLLALMQKTNPDKFSKIFGAHANELVRMTNLPKGDTSSGRSRRVQPLGGHDLWESPWTERFSVAGRDEEFQGCQRDVAISNYMVPALATCKHFGMKSERALTFAFDRSVHFGTSGTRNSFRMHFIKSPNEFLVMQAYVDKFKGDRWQHRVHTINESTELLDKPVW